MRTTSNLRAKFSSPEVICEWGKEGGMEKEGRKAGGRGGEREEEGGRKAEGGMEEGRRRDLTHTQIRNSGSQLRQDMI